MDNPNNPRYRRYVMAIDILMISAVIVNLLYFIQNQVFGENPNNYSTSNISTCLKIVTILILKALHYTHIINEKHMAILFSHFICFYIIMQAFKWMPQNFYICSEGYRMIFLTLKRVLLIGNSVKLGAVMHVYSVFIWYLICIYHDKFYGIETNLALAVAVTLTFGNECMNAFSIFKDSQNNIEHIRKITELQQQLQNIFSSIPEAIFVVKRDMTMIMQNKAADSVLAQTNPDFLNQIQLTLEDQTQVRLTEKVAELVMKGTESPLLGQSTLDEKTFEWKVSLVSWEGEPSFTLLMRDVTALIQLEQAKNDTQVKNVMLRSVSHELRTPANAFTNLIERALGVSDLPVAARKFLELAHDNCQHLLHVVNDLLDFSQFLHGTFRLSKRRFDVRQALTNSFKPFEYMITAAGLQAELKVDPTLPSYGHNDPSRICQVIMNLLSNATKFTRRGCITVTASREDMNSMKVSVIDTGVGVSESQLAKLGSLFGKLKENESLNPQGCGLGLHISNLLAQQLGGQSLQIKSVLGEGTSFSFSVNLAEHDNCFTDYTEDIDEDSGQISLPYFNFSKQASKGKVLVVDDNVFNRDILACILSDIGVECTTASSGYEAIQLISSHTVPFQLMFLDYEMPELNGPQTCKLLHEMLRSNKLSQLPTIVAYTAYSSEEDIQECLNAGMSTYICKPCSSSEIRKLIAKYCSI